MVSRNLCGLILGLSSLYGCDGSSADIKSNGDYFNEIGLEDFRGKRVLILYSVGLNGGGPVKEGSYSTPIPSDQKLYGIATKELRDNGVFTLPVPVLEGDVRPKTSYSQTIDLITKSRTNLGTPKNPAQYDSIIILGDLEPSKDFGKDVYSFSTRGESLQLKRLGK